MEKKSWKEFLDTGLLMYINQVLHAFGWAISYSLSDKGEIESVYPVRTKYKGFNGKAIRTNYKRISKYLSDNADTFKDEAES